MAPQRHHTLLTDIGAPLYSRSPTQHRQDLQQRAADSQEKDQLLGPLLATEQLLQGCMCMVDRHVGATLTTDAWNQFLDSEDSEGAAKLTVRYAHGRANANTRKVIERLLCVKPCDRDKEIRLADTWRNMSSCRNEALS